MSEAKGLIRDEMLAAGQALAYSEPEKTVRACVRACVRVCVCACMCVCWCVCACVCNQKKTALDSNIPPSASYTHKHTHTHTHNARR